MFGRGFGCLGYYSPLGVILAVMIIIVVAVIIYKMFKKNNGDDDALELLKLKFVKGEISEEEYLAKKNILKK